MANGMYILCLGCCIFNTVVMWRNRSTMVDPQLLDVSTLERPSVYIGMEKVKWSPERIKSIPDVHNFPILISQVSNSYPDKVFPIDTPRALGDRGTTSMDDHQILITPDVSTIVQFRILDYEMERCAVTFEIPDARELQSRHTDITLDLNGITKVQVWELDTNREIDPLVINKRSLPPRKTLVDTLHLTMGNHTSTSEFPCQARSLHTYELTCDAQDCRVMFWQAMDAPCLAVYMLQKSSL